MTHHVEEGHEVEEPNVGFVCLVGNAHKMVLHVTSVFACGHVGEGGALEGDVRLIKHAALFPVVAQLPA
eukprot:scaffold1021_cov108-Isochrysis_galbana.AAC.8